ncbi:MAG: hypothetical protein ACRDO8_03085 [Nocardioidaceae bacterium]
MSERPTQEGDPSPRRANILAILVIIIAVLGVLLWKQGGSGAPPSDVAGQATEDAGGGARAAQLGHLVEQLDSAWQARDKDRFVAAAGGSPDSHAWAAQTYHNLVELGVRSFDARFVAEDAAGIRPDGTFAADVTVSWTPGKSSGLETTRTKPATVQLVLRPSEQGYDIVSVRPGKDPEPLWLAGELRVEREGPSDLVYVDPPDPAAAKGRLRPEKLARMGKRARRAVREVVDHKVGSPTIVVPSGASQGAALLGQGGLGQIAAVTTTVDGSTSEAAATYVVLNPDVFTGLGKRAAQIVLTHEVCHALTGAAASSMPLWVAEGFADYVALHDDRLGVRKAASQILRQVREKGAPKELPSDDEFGAGRLRLGATYEEAWLVFELLHQRAPDEAIVQFYAAVRDGRRTGRALEKTFGLDVGSLTDLWREYLTELARS